MRTISHLLASGALALCTAQAGLAQETAPDEQDVREGVRVITPEDRPAETLDRIERYATPNDMPVPENREDERSDPLPATPAPQASRDAPAPPSVLVILAHPDDEITVAPVLARLAREGGVVSVIFATSGDAGPGLSGLEPGQELADLREGEARCAAFALGLDEPQFWRLGDGTLATKARAPDSAARQLIGMVAEAIAQVEPKIVMTWGPDGGYGHSDHRMVSAAVTQVIQSMDGERPDLIYSVIPATAEAALPEFEQWATIHPSLVTDRLRYRPDDLAAADAAMRCYESQFPPEARSQLIRMLHRTVWRGKIHFRLAFPSPF